MKKTIKGKHYPHTDLHQSVKCRECGKPIKSRIVLTKSKPVDLCYKHWKEQQNGVQKEKFDKNIKPLIDEIRPKAEKILGRKLPPL